MSALRKKLFTASIKNSDFWYLVGLITSDGCLSSDGRHIEITTKEREFLAGLKERLGLKGNICKKKNSRGVISHRIHISNISFYKFLISIGLMPAKSFKIGPVKVPGSFFKDFLRGVIDGDGNIRGWMHPSNKGEQWSLRIYSVSLSFSKWLCNKIKETLKAKGRIHIEKRKPSNEKGLYILKYGKMAAKVILKKCYYPQAICLQRKGILAKECIASYRGWKTSKTIFSYSFN